MSIAVISLVLSLGAAVAGAWALVTVAKLNKSFDIEGEFFHDWLDQHEEEIGDLITKVVSLQSDIDDYLSDGQVTVPPTKKSATAPTSPLITANIARIDDGLPLQGHTFVLGNSNGGKSNLIMGQIIKRLANGQEVHVIDTKEEIGPIFGRHCEVVGPEGAEDKFAEMLSIAKERRKLFAEASGRLKKPVRDLGEYMKVTGERLPIITLIIEEMIVLMDQIKEEDLITMLVMCRSAGIFVLAVSQYLDRNILSRKGAVNFNTRVFLGRYDRIAASILFGTLEKADTDRIKEYVGFPGKAAIQEGNTITTRTMPLITEGHLAPFFGEE